jgi:prepilin-type N-terminal cleavage/methylation domain-containing protein
MTGKGNQGFTLVEIMIVVMIIALLAVLALPAFSRARLTSQNVRFINDLRMACGAFQQYTLDTCRYPPDRTPGVIPPGMAEYLQGMQWTDNTTIGGRWDWDYEQFGVKAGVSVYCGLDMQDARLTEIDRRIDDGNLDTGNFRKRSQGYIGVIEL